MTKRRNENLSQEPENVQNKLLDELMNNDVKSENTSENNINNNINVEKQTSEKNVALGNQAKTATMDEPVNEIVVGSKVKLKEHVGHDMLGKRIHNGIKNYVYTVKLIRPDNYCLIECMAYQFTIAKADLDLQ